MQTVQIVLDEDLLLATDKAARSNKMSRSALVREALHAHLRQLEIRAKEEREIEGYRRQPQTIEEEHLWVGIAAWPEE